MTAIFSVVLFVVLLTGCVSPVPKATLYTETDQLHMQAVDHWRLLANQVAGDLTPSYRRLTAASTPIPAVYVQSDDKVPFDRAYRSFIITELSRLGIPVSSEPQALRISWSVQAVEHRMPPTIETGRLPRTEVIVTTYAIDTARAVTVMHRSDVYYVHNEERALYVLLPPTPGKPVAVHKTYSVRGQ